MFKSVNRPATTHVGAAQSAHSASPTPERPATQRWTRQFTGTARGVHFKLRVQREAGGALHAWYQVTPGHPSGWPLSGHAQPDGQFTLRGHNGAVFEGRFLPGGGGVIAHFQRGRAFEVDQLTLTRTFGAPASTLPALPAAPKPRVARPAPVTGAASPKRTERAPARPPAPSAGQLLRPFGLPVHAASPATASPASAAPGTAGGPWKAKRTGLRGFDRQPEVQAAILWGAEQLRVDPNELAATIGYETMGAFSPAKENEAARKDGKKGAVGFIQFTPSVGIPALNGHLKSRAGRAQARALGITVTHVTRADLLGLSPMEQMRFVVLYFQIPDNSLPAGAKYDKIYQKIIAPNRNGEVLYREGGKAYEKNRQFDRNHDGQITRHEAAATIRHEGYVTRYFERVQTTPGVARKAPQAQAATKTPQTNAKAPPKVSPPVRPEPSLLDRAWSALTSAYDDLTGQAPEHQAPPAPPQTARDTTAQTKERRAASTKAGHHPPTRPDTAQGFDAQVTQALLAFTQAYRFPIYLRWEEDGKTQTKTIEVQTPYFMNKGNTLAKVEDERRKIHRDEQSRKKINKGRLKPDEMKIDQPREQDQRVFDLLPAGVKTGKNSAATMASCARTIAKANPFGVPTRDITGAMITAWMRRYGIGVDCSGFVSQALNDAVKHAGGQDPDLKEASGMLSHENHKFDAVKAPRDVRPGDTMWLQGHIRIVLQVGPGPEGKGIQMMIAESTVDPGLPYGVAHGLKTSDRIGVDRALWWFQNPDRFEVAETRKRRSKSYEWTSSSKDVWRPVRQEEALRFSRFKALSRLRPK